MNVKADRTQVKSEVLILKVTSKEKREIRALAEKHGFSSMSEFIRRASLMKLATRSMIKNRNRN